MSKELSLQQPQPSVVTLMQGVIDKGVTSENVAVMGQLIELHERMERRDAEKQFAASFVALQNEMPVIVATSVIPNRGKYERYEDVMRVVGPLLSKNGFAVSFSQHADDKRINVTCHLRHIAGHSSETSFAVRTSGKSDSETQSDCKASTTAKRNALLQALNIVIRQDVFQDEDNPNNEGECITRQEAADLRDWVDATGSNVENFLAFAGAKTFEEISATKLATLQASLRKKETRK